MLFTLEESLNKVAEFSQLTVHRVPTGLPAIDRLCGGPAPGELFTIVGRSFTGKSIVGQHVIYANPKTPSIFFSLEMPLVQAAIRLFGMWSGQSLPELQAKIEKGGLPDDLYDMADAFPYHIIVDTPGISVDGMADKFEEYRSVFKRQPEFTVIDYLELVGKTKIHAEGYQGTESQIAQIRDWARYENTRVFLVHQANKSEPKWRPPSEDSPRGGGYTESDFMIGVYRPGANPDLDQAERRWMDDKMAVNIIKNRAYFQLLDEKIYRFDPSSRLLEVM